MSTGQPVDEWVARLARPTDTQVQAWELAAALDGLPVAVHDASAAAARVPRTPRAAKRRRRIIATAAVTATLGAASVGVAAAAGAFGAHTGIFGSPGMTENDTSEYLDLNTPDFLTVARGLAKGVDFAPGYSAEQYLPSMVPDMSRPGPTQGRHSMMQVTGVKGTIEGWAFCSWERTWLAAAQIGNAQAQQAAITHMRAITALPVMSAINAKNWDNGILDAAASGNPSPLQRDVQISCPSGSPR